MKLSEKTIEVLKNFSNINTSMFFRKGNVMRAIDGENAILAEAKIEEEFPSDFGIYELNQLLGILSLHKEQPEINIQGNDLIITGYGGRNKVVYRTCSSELIKVPPVSTIDLSDPQVSFVLTKEDFDWVMKASSIISAPNIIFTSNGDDISVVATDLKDDSSKSNELVIGKGNGDTFKFNLKTMNMKMISGNYDVSLYAKGFSHFKNKDTEIQYWITVESGSSYNKK